MSTPQLSWPSRIIYDQTRLRSGLSAMRNTGQSTSPTAGSVPAVARAPTNPRTLLLRLVAQAHTPRLIIGSGRTEPVPETEECFAQETGHPGPTIGAACDLPRHVIEVI